MIENFWRADSDEHSTMLSKSEDGCTRWGSSIQLTARGVRAVERYQEAGADPKYTVSAYDRAGVSSPAIDPDVVSANSIA